MSGVEPLQMRVKLSGHGLSLIEGKGNLIYPLYPQRYALCSPCAICPVMVKRKDRLFEIERSELTKRLTFLDLTIPCSSLHL
jgi:hypothetical protein